MARIDIATEARRRLHAGGFGEVCNLSERVRAYLLSEVTAGSLRPGDRLNEAELARRLGISRNPVREAVAGLVRQGFLVARPRRGAFLRTFSRADVRDVYSFRICVEDFALRQAFEIDDPAFGPRVRAVAAEMLEAAHAGDVGRVHEIDIRFHRTICVFSRNRVTLSAHESIDGAVRMLMASVDLRQEPLEDAARSHLEVAEAIAARQPDRAAWLLREHLLQTQRFVTPHFAAMAPAEAEAEAPVIRQPEMRSK